MTTNAKLARGNFQPNASGFVPAVTSQLAGWFYTNTSSVIASKNLAFNNATASIAGSPTYADGYVTFGGRTSFLQTTIADAANFTVLLACRTFATGVGNDHPGFAACYGVDVAHGITGGSVIYQSSDSSAPAGIINCVGEYLIGGVPVQGGGNINLSVTNFSTFKFIAIVFNDTAGTRTIYNITDATSKAATPLTPGSRLVNASILWSVGLGPQPADAAHVDFAYAGFYTKALSSDVEIPAIYSQVAYYLANAKSIII